MPTLFESPPKEKKDHKKDSAHRASMGPFTAFAFHPKGVRFETQEEEEQVILFLRQHVIVLLPPAVLGIVMILAPSIILPVILRQLGALPFVLPIGFTIVGTVFWLVATSGFLLATFLHWFFNIYIVTNQRVIDIDFVNLLFKEFSEADLTKIQDLSFSSKGIFAAVFDFGDVVIQTAGELPNFDFQRVPNPDDVVKTISELTSSRKGKHI